ncbi:sporulation protein [Alkalihalobacillus deserti]|uniref:sporulation protein n=1 Tax=Alkalihalobacillus deserti TaxID=2879466 RepID=UPI001D13A882|nr:sporulation protein [Alkalihalobacillus deserti]
MILRKYASLIGIGSAQIDLILPKETFKRGDEIVGYFLIKGGIVEQQIKRIDSNLIRIDHMNNEETILSTKTITVAKRINQDMEEKLSFNFKLDADTPVSTHKNSYGFRTKLTFNEGVVSTDLDYIKII